ncbi:beta family protein [Micromonospora narathiwatensis]|uniref:Beta protein n=1 Tax=Micromonospora narathiwatensis TaxID=299146 RepID=A0A1A9AFT6_9ACTN|nr:beta family protein [Micromonospora narathiwatensis]SBT55046.1 Beta protein [Micromonospora narathiwatensis]
MVPAHDGRAAEPVYQPVLVGRRGALEALAHLDDATAPLLAPVLDVHAFDPYTMDLLGRLPAGLLPAVDVSALPDGPESELVRWGVPLVPVIGLAEHHRRLVAHGAAARAYARRAVVRLRTGQDRAGPDATTGAVERVWRLARLVPEQCDLLIDAGDVCCPADVRLAEPRIRRLADWSRRHAWRSVTVLAGGIPPTLARLPTDEPVRLDRFDWRLWQRLSDLGVGYGDYGVDCAVPGSDGPADRLPTLRYATDDAWWIYRWSRRGGRGDERFADLCRTLVSAPHWPAAGAGFSWGDHEILRRARHGAGAGSPANWLAWSTSHHLAHVLAALRRPGWEQRGGPWPAGQYGPERGRHPRGGAARRAG